MRRLLLLTLLAALALPGTAGAHVLTTQAKLGTNTSSRSATGSGYVEDGAMWGSLALGCRTKEGTAKAVYSFPLPDSCKGTPSVKVSFLSGNARVSSKMVEGRLRVTVTRGAAGSAVISMVSLSYYA